MSENEKQSEVSETVVTAKVKGKGKGKGKGKARKERRDAIGVAEFLKVYVPMAVEGKTAKEIGAALGRDAQFVTIKASQLRKSIKEDTSVSDEVRAARLAKVPKLKLGATKSVMSALDSLEF